MVEHDYENFPELTNKQIEEFGFSSPHVQFVEDFVATVVKVHDGDTITLQTDSRSFDFPLRLLDIDAPELNEGGEVAGDWLRGVIEGEKVNIIIDTDNRVGKYGRLLGKVLSLGQDVGEIMLAAGLVKEFGKKNEGKPVNLDNYLREASI